MLYIFKIIVIIYVTHLYLSKLFAYLKKRKES